MKRIRLIAFLVIAVLISSACDKTIKPDTPDNAAWLLKLAIDEGEYDRFNSYFSEGRVGSVSKEAFDQMTEIATAGTEYVHYRLLKFENGEMFLVRMTPEPVNGEYKIEDILVVTEEMKPFFK